MRMPSASHSDSITAVVSGVVRPGSSSIESSRRYCAAGLGREGLLARGAVLVVAPLHLLSAGQTYASSFEKSASLRVRPTDATRARTRSTRSAGTCAFTHAAASSGACVCASSGERSKVM